MLLRGNVKMVVVEGRGPKGEFIWIVEVVVAALKDVLIYRALRQGRARVLLQWCRTQCQNHEQIKETLLITGISNVGAVASQLCLAVRRLVQRRARRRIRAV